MGRLTPQEIREQEFKQSALGFSREQVHEFLDTVAEELETLIRETNEIHAENREVRLTLKTYMNVEDTLKETLLLAQRTSQETIRNAQNESETIIRKANTEKDALLFSAKEDLHEIQSEIRQLAAHRDEILIKLKSLLRSNLAVLEEVYSKPVETKSGVEPVINLGDERIVDFSHSDLVVDDLSQPEEPEIQLDDTQDFSRE